MTITPKIAHRDIAIAAATLATLERRIGQAVHTARYAIEHPEVLDDRPRAEATGRSKGAISNPTMDIALGRITRHDRILDDLEGQLASMRLTVALVQQFVERWAPPTSTPPTRCHGGKSVEPWSDPTCTNWAAEYQRADGTFVLRGDGLCDACRKRRERHQREVAA